MNFIRHPFSEWGDQGLEKKRTNAPKREVSFSPINGHLAQTRHVRKVPRSRTSRIILIFAIRVYGWALVVDPPLSFDRSPALTGFARRPSLLPALWPRPVLHLVSSKTA